VRKVDMASEKTSDDDWFAQRQKEKAAKFERDRAAGKRF